MFNLLNCYLSGRHDYGVSCEPGVIFLRCIHCGKRSTGWELQATAVRQQTTGTASRLAARVVPFSSGRSLQP